MKRIVLAYSGDLSSSAAIAWLAEKHRAEVVSVTLDLGQGRDLKGVRDRALAIGAVRAHVLDAQAAFAADVLVPALGAGALQGPRAPLGPALSRPVIAKHLLSIARIEGADAVAHGGTETGPLAGSIRALDASVPMLLPVRAWGMTPSELVEFARKRGIPVPDAAPQRYAIETSIWGRAITADGSGDFWEEPPEDLYRLTRSPAAAPDRPAYVELTFDRGVPVETNGVSMPLVELIASLESIAGAHGVGRLDASWIGRTGASARVLGEAPAIVVLDAAHAALRALVTPDDLHRLAGDMRNVYADLVNRGRWYSQTRDAIEAFALTVQKMLIGVVRVKLFKGQCHVVGCQSSRAGAEREQATGQAPVAIARN